MLERDRWKFDVTQSSSPVAWYDVGVYVGQRCRQEGWTVDQTEQGLTHFLVYVRREVINEAKARPVKNNHSHESSN